MSSFFSNPEDITAALPAAVARIFLGNKKEPLVGLLSSMGQKFSALVGSICFAVMMGQLARFFPQTQQWVTLIVIAAAFTGQDAAIALIKKSQKELKNRL